MDDVEVSVGRRDGDYRVIFAGGGPVIRRITFKAKRPVPIQVVGSDAPPVAPPKECTVYLDGIDVIVPRWLAPVSSEAIAHLA